MLELNYILPVTKASLYNKLFVYQTIPAHFRTEHAVVVPTRSVSPAYRGTGFRKWGTFVSPVSPTASTVLLFMVVKPASQLFFYIGL